LIATPFALADPETAFRTASSQPLAGVGAPAAIPARTSAPAFAAESAPFCVFRCSENAKPPSTTRPAKRMSTTSVVANSTMIWPPPRRRRVRRPGGELTAT